MHAQIHTIAFRGIETIAVTVQIHIANGLPAMAIVGLADKAVAESRERVRGGTGLDRACFVAKTDRGQSGTSRCVKRRGAVRFTDCPWPDGGYGRGAARRG